MPQILICLALPKLQVELHKGVENLSQRKKFVKAQSVAIEISVCVALVV